MLIISTIINLFNLVWIICVRTHVTEVVIGTDCIESVNPTTLQSRPRRRPPPYIECIQGKEKSLNVMAGLLIPLRNGSFKN